MKTTGEVATELGLTVTALFHHMGTGHVARPRRRVGRAMLWAGEEVQAARQALSAPGRRQRGRPRKEASGT